MNTALYDMIEQRLALLEKWESVFAQKATHGVTDYSGALYQCHNERFFLTQLQEAYRQGIVETDIENRD